MMATHLHEIFDLPLKFNAEQASALQVIDYQEAYSRASRYGPELISGVPCVLSVATNGHGAT